MGGTARIVAVEGAEAQYGGQVLQVQQQGADGMWRLGNKKGRRSLWAAGELLQPVAAKAPARPAEEIGDVAAAAATGWARAITQSEIRRGGCQK